MCANAVCRAAFDAGNAAIVRPTTTSKKSGERTKIHDDDADDDDKKILSERTQYNECMSGGIAIFARVTAANTRVGKVSASERLRNSATLIQ